MDSYRDDYDGDYESDGLKLCPICQDQYTTTSRCTSCAQQDVQDRYEPGDDAGTMRLPFNYTNAEELEDEQITANLAACYAARQDCDDPDDAEAISDMIYELEAVLHDRHKDH